jgi:hypothetical protein
MRRKTARSDVMRPGEGPGQGGGERVVVPPAGGSAPGLGSLETAKEVLAEVFGARPGEVEEMKPLSSGSSDRYA